jgi:excisionase family DNA binding protein
VSSEGCDTSGSQLTSSPWLTVSEAADRARCGVKTIYREVQAGRLRAARIGGRRELRLRPEWIDEWLDRTATVVMVGGVLPLTRRL